VDGHVYYRFGQWCDEDAEQSSNYRELKNLVDSLRKFAEDRNLRGVEVFLFTDNLTAEAAFWKGNSSSRKLFELVLELKRLEYDLGLILHVIHVSGTRMMAQGTDGLSRADFLEGVMAGKAMTSFVPLHLSGKERSAGIEDWLLWHLPSAGGGTGKLLAEADWFKAGHTPGAWLWIPAPAAAEVVVEQLGKARHKRPHVMHMVAVPRLMTGRWRQQLTRESDFYFRIPVGCPLWPSSMYEPLLVFVCLPFVSHRPWLGGHCSTLEALVGSDPTCGKQITSKQGLFCGNFSFVRGPFPPCRNCWCDSCYRQLLHDNFRVNIAVDEEGEEITRSGELDRFKFGRKGDSLITGFQCDRCHVRNIRWREPVEGDAKEDLQLLWLRRAILDSLWSRESSTVRSNLSRVVELELLGDELDYYESTPRLGPYPLRDTFGMKVATIMIHKSTQPGRNAAAVQYDTIHQLRTGYSNVYHASTWQETVAVMASDLKKLHITSCPTDNIWFGKFMLGMQKRLGRQIKQDCGLSIDVMLKLQELHQRSQS
jgi:hypothetical protein